MQDVDFAALHKRVLKFMQKSRPGSDPSPGELRRLVRGASST
jgi:hypothetical protein